MRHVSFLRFRRAVGFVLVACVLWLLAVGAGAFFGHVEHLKTRSFNLPEGHVFDISLPRGVGGGETTSLTVTTVDSNDPELVKDGYLLLATVLQDFPGPFWAGPRGSLRVTITLNRPAADYPLAIQCIEDLYRYVQWLVVSRDVADGCEVFRTEVEGLPAITKRWSDFKDLGVKRPRSNTVYSFLVSRDLFVEVAFKIIPWNDDRDSYSAWLPKAEELREAILRSIVLRPTNTVDRSSQSDIR